MEVVKIIGIGFIALISIIVLKQYKPEFAVYISILTGILILTLSLSKITGIINLLTDISNRANLNTQFLKIILKITGIAILTEFAVSICNDCNENAIANKINIGSQVLIITISLPIMTSLLETLVKILP